MSTLNLYKNCKILPERNFRVEYLETYLQTLTKSTISNFQLVKHELDLEIKVPKEQMTLEMFASNNFNYCSLQNDNGKMVYYFIIGKKWVSKECTRLKLRMDTINSFIDDITLSDRTKILREHKDRFAVVSHHVYVFQGGEPQTIEPNKIYSIGEFGSTAGEIVSYPDENGKLYIFDGSSGLTDPEIYENVVSISLRRSPSARLWVVFKDGRIIDMATFATKSYAFKSTSNSVYTDDVVVLYGIIIDAEIVDGYRPLIDFYTEGLSPVLYKKSEKTILDNYALDGSQEENSFYLIYKNRTDPTDEDPNPPVDTYLCSDEDLVLARSPTGLRDATLNISQVPYRASEDGAFIIYYGDGTQTPTINVKKNGQSSSFSISSNQAVFFYKRYTSRYGDVYYYQLATWNGSSWNRNEKVQIDVEVLVQNCKQIRRGLLSDTPTQILNDDSYFSDDPVGERTIASINTLDRTLSTLIKIIKLPYSPTSISKNADGEYTIDENVWEYDNTLEFLKLKDASMKFNKEMNLSIDFDIYFPLKIKTWLNYTQTDPKSMEYEPKLFHSDYYRQKVVYDSFSFAFQLEKMNEYAPFTMTFTTTTTMTSNFMFTFGSYILKNSEDDYDNIMPIRRNNEIVLYNSDYLNYIRTGFNYDVKTKERQETNLIASSVAQGIGGIASFVGGIASSNPALIAGGIALITSLSVNLITTANSIAQQEQNIQAKLLQTKMQSVSVAGSDDVDLMSKYTNGNKAKMCLYEVSDKLKKALFDVFYYTGYVADYLGIPQTNTRRNFNFVSAEIVFAEVPNLPADIIADIRQKYGEGITFLHKFDTDIRWDFEQEFENWETSIPEPQPPTTYIVEEPATIAKLNQGKEWVLDPNMNPRDLGRIQTTSANNMVARKRRRSDLSIIPNSQIQIGRSVVKNTDDEFTFNHYEGSSSYPATIRELISEYPDKDYYWTIQVVAGSINSYYQEQNYLDALLGYIQEIE